MKRQGVRLVVAVLAAVSAGQSAFAQAFGPAEQREVLAQVAAFTPAERQDILTTMMPNLIATLNGEMPMRVDNVTTATAVTYVPTVIEYTYQIDPGTPFPPDARSVQRSILIETMCGQHDTFFILALGVTLRYVYLGTKADIGTLDIVLADCPAPPPGK